MNNYKVGVLGFRGYSGAELIRLLTRHPHVELMLLEHRRDSEQRPQPMGAKQPRSVKYTPEAAKAENLALVFLATPADVSMDLAPPLLDAGAKVIDLSAAFRLRSPAEMLMRR